MADQTNAIAASDQIDAARAIRMFANLASTALGVTPDQNYASEDAYLGNYTGQHAAADPYRGAAVQGTTTPFGQTAASGGFVITPGLLILGAVVWLVLKKG